MVPLVEGKMASVSIFPNPASKSVALFVAPGSANNITAELYSSSGVKLHTKENIRPAVQYDMDVSSLAVGIYHLVLCSAEWQEVRQVVVLR